LQNKKSKKKIRLKFDKKKPNEDEILKTNPKQNNLQLKELEPNLKD
jgi:hypothetical protein